jgi:hypothetical protein
VEINIYNLFSLIAAVVAIFLMLYIIPKQVNEIRRPKNGFTALRWRLLALPTLYILCVLPRVPLLAGRLHVPPTSDLAAFTSVSTSIGLLTFAVFMVLIYTYKEKK